MHGKVFKRSFLKENNISFSTKIRHLEDSYFTTCVLGSLDASEITYFDFTTYLWRLNLKSLTRKKSKYSYMVNTFDEFYKMPFLAYDFLQEKKSKMRYTYIVNSLFAIYIVLNSDLFEFEELKDRRNKYLLSLEKDIKLKRNIFMLIRKEDLAKLYDTQMNYLAVRNGIKYVRKTLDDFLDEYIITSK